MGWKTRKDKLATDQADDDAPLENQAGQENGYDPDIEADANALARLAQVSAQDDDRDPFVLDLNNDAFRTDTQRTSLDPSAFQWFNQGGAEPGAAAVLKGRENGGRELSRGQPPPAVQPPGHALQAGDGYVEPAFTPSYAQPVAESPNQPSPEYNRPRFEIDATAAAASRPPVSPERINRPPDPNAFAPVWDAPAGAQAPPAPVRSPAWDAAPAPATSFDVPSAFGDPSPGLNGSSAAAAPPSPAAFRSPEPSAPFQPNSVPFQPVTGFATGAQELPAQPGPPMQPRPPDPQPVAVAPAIAPSAPASAAYYQPATPYGVGQTSSSPYPAPPPPLRPDEGQSINSFSRESVAAGLVTGEGDFSIPKVAPFIVAGAVQEEEQRAADGGHYLIIRMRNLAASYKLTKDVTTIGRPDSVTKNYPDVEIELDDGVSRKHSEIRLKGNDYFVVDVGSKNGTLLNGDLLDVDIECKLSHGDRIRVGEKTEIVFE